MMVSVLKGQMCKLIHNSKLLTSYATDGIITVTVYLHRSNEFKSALATVLMVYRWFTDKQPVV